MGGSCGKRHTKRLLAISFCSQCSKMPIPNLESPLGPHLHQCECSPCALRWLYDGFGGRRKVWAPASAATFLHHLPLAFSPRLFFPVATLDMTVTSCFHGRKTVDFSQVSPSLFTGETSPMHHKTHVFQK